MKASTASRTIAVTIIRTVDGDGAQPPRPPEDEPPRPGIGTFLRIRPAEFIAASPFPIRRILAAHVAARNLVLSQCQSIGDAASPADGRQCTLRVCAGSRRAALATGRTRVRGYEPRQRQQR